MSGYGIQSPIDPSDCDGPSEFSWGKGLTPEFLDDANPSEGGRYHGTSPDERQPRIGSSRDARI